MARVEASDFAERDTTLIFLAKDVAEAERVEDLLTDEGVDFMTTLERFVSGLSLFSSERSGIGFHVLGGQADFCRDLLRKDLPAGIVEDPDVRK